MFIKRQKLSVISVLFVLITSVAGCSREVDTEVVELGKGIGSTLGNLKKGNILQALSEEEKLQRRQAAKEAEENALKNTFHPEWSRNASVYEVSIRNYTKEGTFKAFENELPRLKEFGVTIIWLMPIHPVGEKNRKGTLGNVYSIKDHYAVNPEYGTMEDFKSLVAKIHELGMYVIIDWVAKFGSWDHVLLEKEPDYFTRDGEGNLVNPRSGWSDVFDLNFIPPTEDYWSDVVDFSFLNPQTRQWMIEAMQWWIEETDIDGFRAHASSMIPLDFWERVRTEVGGIKDILIAGEQESVEINHRLHEKAFDVTWGWDLLNHMHGLGYYQATDLDEYFNSLIIDHYYKRQEKTYPPDAFRMHFTSSHYQNAYKGTVFERFHNATNLELTSAAAEVFAAYTLVWQGMPLVFNGQEVGLFKRVSVTEKDPIEWNFDHHFYHVYKTLLNAKRNTKALWNGVSGGLLTRVPTSNDWGIYAFVREKGDSKVFALFNFSAVELDVELHGTDYEGDYVDVFTGEETTFEVKFGRKPRVQFGPWQYYVYSNNTDGDEEESRAGEGDVEGGADGDTEGDTEGEEPADSAAEFKEKSDEELKNMSKEERLAYRKALREYQKTQKEQ